MPGDTFSKALRFGNDCSSPLDDRLVFIQRESLWKCDGERHNLYYETTWSPDADQHLEQGETESVTVTVTFPQAASNECQGDTGYLLARRRFLNKGWERIVCKGLSSIVSLLSKICNRTDDLTGYSCIEVDRSWFGFFSH